MRVLPRSAYYTDNLMHNLRAERGLQKPQAISTAGQWMAYGTDGHRSRPFARFGGPFKGQRRPTYTAYSRCSFFFRLRTPRTAIRSIRWNSSIWVLGGERTLTADGRQGPRVAFPAHAVVHLKKTRPCLGRYRPGGSWRDQWRRRRTT